MSPLCGNLRDEFDDKGRTIRDLCHRSARQTPSRQNFRQFRKSVKNLRRRRIRLRNSVPTPAEGCHPGTQELNLLDPIQARKILHPLHIPNTCSIHGFSMRRCLGTVNW